MLEIKICKKEPYYNQLTASNIDALQFYAIITVILKGLYSHKILKPFYPVHFKGFTV